MVVSFTPNIGLAKPSDTELALNWARGTELQEDNNNIIIAESNFSHPTYTPVIIGATSNPNVGAGSIRGEYQDFGGFIVGGFILEFTDPGVSAGSGEYAISLPFVIDNSFHTVDTAFGQAPGTSHCIGEGYIHDTSNVQTSGTVALAPVTISGVSYVRIVTETYTGKVTSTMTSAVPYVTATGDKICGSFFYKRT